MRKPAGPPASQQKCARNFRHELACLEFRVYAAAGETKPPEGRTPNQVEHSTLSVERWALQVPSPESRPVIACYCATFLKPEMLHIYRQITSLTRVSPVVIAQKREEAERYPFDRITIVGKPATHFARRFWFKQVRAAPWQVSRQEIKTLI